MRIVMLGLRGLHPDLEIGGFDTAFAEIAPRLVARGHSVTMYCRACAHSPGRRPTKEDGVSLFYMPSPGGKNYAAIVSTLLAVLHAFVWGRHDVWFFVNVGMGHHAALARLSGRPVVMNVDGLDWTRGKWGPVARFYFQSAARSAVRFCTELITDAVAMQEYYRQRLGRETQMISYGAEIGDSLCPDRIAQFGVVPREYHLIVSRFIPENSLIEMLEGFRRSKTTKHLLLVGNASYEDSYQQRLREIAASDDRIIMAGLVKDQSLLRELWCNCAVYLHGHSVGGTNPALLRAMGFGSCVLALDTVFNREALANAGRYFSNSSDLTAHLDALDEDGDTVARLRQCAQARASAEYDWERVTDRYEQLLYSAIRDGQSLARTARRAAHSDGAEAMAP